MRPRELMLLCALGLLFPPAAAAATEAIDATHTTADFAGTITEPTGVYGSFRSPVFDVGDTYDTCHAPVCDLHTVSVGPGAAHLQIDATSDAQKLNVELVDPTGYTLDLGSGTSSLSYRWDKPAPGEWTMRVWGVSKAPSSSYDVKTTFVLPAVP